MASWIVPALLFASVLANVVLLLLLLRTRRSNRRIPTTYQPVTIGSSSAISALITDSDALGNLAKFVYWYRRRKATAKDGYVAAQIILQSMEAAWGLRQLGDFQEKANYDPDEHDPGSGQTPSPGDSVRIVEPGWSLGNRVIKRAIVKADR